MDASFTPLIAWSYGLAGGAFALLALQVGVRHPGGAHGFVLLLAALSSAVWGLLGSAFAVTHHGAFLATVAIVDVIRIGFWYCFLILLVVGSRGIGALRQVRGLVIAAAVLVLAGLAVQAYGVMQVGAYSAVGRVGLVNLGMAVFALVLVEILLRNLPAEARWNVKPLCIGLAGVFGFDVYLYADAVLFNRIDLDAFSIRGVVHAVAVPFIAVTAARNGNWTSKVTLSRRVVFHSAALVASGVYLLFVAAAGYYVRVFGGGWGGAFQIALLFAGLLGLGVLAASGSTRAKLRVLISKHFYRYRYDYRDEWLRFTQTLSASDGQAALGQQIIRGLANLIESPSGALWLRDASAQRYVQAARWNMPVSGSSEALEGPLPQFLRKSGWVINLEEYRSVPGRYGGFGLPAWLSDTPDAWLIVPLSMPDDLMGFVVIGTPRTRIELDWEVKDLLKTAGRQAASFLGHMQATEALLESRKFDAFNRMSAFVVHDLKNLISQLSLMLKNAERHKYNAEFQQDMLMTVAHTVDRMKQMMMQLREGTTPVQAAGAVDVGAVVRKIQRTKQGQQPAPGFRSTEELIAKGHPDRIERVIGHIVQNAIDATGTDGEVQVSLRREGNFAAVEVRDTGSGMPAEFARERLFKPFQTTKAGGMGIGAYESYQYVHELGGDILVDSKLGVGTTMRILLPLHDTTSEGSTKEVVA